MVVSEANEAMKNRIIKFRTWADGKMDYNFKATPNTKEVGIHDFFGALYFGEEIEWMQFTGLLDKNGKEIYEGDLLKAIPNGNEPRSILEVYWSEKHAAFRLRIKDSWDEYLRDYINL